MKVAIIKGLLLAIGLILPLGVQNTFVFLQGTRQRRWIGGLPVALTAALCDTTLITLAVSGVSLVVLNVPWFKTALIWGGVCFLLYMGWVTWRSNTSAAGVASGAEKAASSASSGEWPVRKQVIYAATVSLLNPHAILDTVAVIGVTSVSFPVGPERLAFALTCIAVSWLWFVGLMSAGYLIGALGPTGRVHFWLNRASALIMWAVAVQLMVSARTP